MSDLVLAATPARQLIEFIVRDFSVDGAHMLMMGYGDNSYLGFGKFRGELDCNALGYKNFIREIESKIDDRPGYLSFLCLTSYIGAQPPEEGTIVFSELREPRKRYGWLLNENMIQPLSARSLKEMVSKERRVRLADSASPKMIRNIVHG
jgi:hypothetical protein